MIRCKSNIIIANHQFTNISPGHKQNIEPSNYLNLTSTRKKLNNRFREKEIK